MIDIGGIPNVPPAIIYIIGAALLPLLGTGKARKIYLVVLAALGLIAVALIRPQTDWVFSVMPGFELTFLHADSLSLIMGYIFAIIGAAAIIYSLDIVKENGELICGLLYLGSALGAVFAGDFFTLYIFWEIMAFSSVGLIWYSRTERATNAGMRYILFHLFGGCAMLGGIIIHYMNTGSIAVGPVESGIGYFLLLIGIGVNTAFISLHSWLPDSYPKATIAGAVFMCVFTTKTGVYVLARTFPGVEAVAYMGGVMCLYGVAFALMQNDVRKLLSYHIVSQVGYMVAGIGIGTYIGINGGIAHVFNHILYKALLFMCMGAVIYATGKNNLTELGGLAKKMPITMITCVIAALSISGMPGFNGYVSKGMIVHAVELEGMHILALVLILGSVGTFLSFLKLTYFVFFKRNDGIKAKEAPLPMLIAMSVTASLCVVLGVYPELLYRILPYPGVAFHYHAYAFGHTIGTLELLMMTAVGFVALQFVFSPHEKITYDIDYLYRKAGRGFIWFCEQPLVTVANFIDKSLLKLADAIVWFSRNPTAASRIMVAMVGAVVTRPFFNPSYRQYARDLEELKRMYPGEVPRVAIGTGVLLALVLFTLYLIVYLTHGVLWV
uniref:NAD(P)H-quinone oxidoreductase subunit 2, chloroplastic n=1 Tax=Candidatus Methanophagaceae archaeon ANME-1 ERB6 TaxID=2759912 RepID=A0A7G9Z0I5_9EURY|nr:NAD(P)H-quinone oxidoreductase subunit 2, chloroplastic [Methanosarcinales archaeon ANME-1 ERB6]